MKNSQTVTVPIRMIRRKRAASLRAKHLGHSTPLVGLLCFPKQEPSIVGTINLRSVVSHGRYPASVGLLVVAEWWFRADPTFRYVRPGQIQAGYLLDVIDLLLCARDIRTSMAVAAGRDRYASDEPRSLPASISSGRWCAKDECCFVTYDGPNDFNEYLI